MSETYYLQDKRGYCGNSILWWRRGGGYTANLGEAEVFTKEDAYSRHDSRSSDVPWPKGYIDSRADLTVDMQKVKRAEAMEATENAASQIDPPDTLIGALQDTVDSDPGEVRPAKAYRMSASEERTLMKTQSRSPRRVPESTESAASQHDVQRAGDQSES